MKKALNILYLAIGLTVFMYVLLFLSPFENAIYLIDSGAYDYSIRTSKGYSAESDYYENKIEDIVIIDIDERSLAKNRLGRFASWPHHEYYAEVIKNISRDNPKVIAFDIIIDEDKDPEKNKILDDAVKNSGKVVSALYFENANPDKYIEKDLEEPKGYDYEKDSYNVPGLEVSPIHQYDHLSNPNIELYNNSLGTGAVLFTPDDDGVIRRLVPFYQYLDRFYPFLGIQMFAKANNVDQFEMIGNDTLVMKSEQESIRRIPLKDGNIFISYTGEIDKFRRISFYSILRNNNYQQLEPGFFKDKYVIIGASAAGLFDLRVTPVQETFPGVGIHANIL
ncbi:MAG: CHASE2 domain-containing protein, partial [Calditrichaeota bacterium]|nr:CHASE2 domain-containing protein [Calditrichota bacterium]